MHAQCHAFFKQDLYRMKELIHEKPKDVIQWIEEEGVIKLGEFEVQVSQRGEGGASHFYGNWRI